MANRPWTPTEETYLREHRATITAREMGAVLGRSRSSVTNKLHQMGLTAKLDPVPKPVKKFPQGVREYLLGGTL